MQKEFMLKLFILNILCTSSLFSASLSSTEIITMVAEIKKERLGISLAKLEDTGRPFIIKLPKQKESTEVREEVAEVVAVAEVDYQLKAILNHAAFINTKWYKKGATIGNYKIANILTASVILEGSSGNRTLNLEKKKKLFIKSNRGYR